MALVWAALLVALAIGVPIAFALGLSGFVYLLAVDAYPSTLAATLFASLSSSSLLAIPFFILAAEILSRSGATERLIRCVDAFLGHTKGGLPVVAVVATAFFSAICGSSVATAAAIGVVLIPEMMERGYDRFFSVGLIASAGGLGILIPPSIPLIVYGMVTEQSIGRLFGAGMVFGIALTVFLIAVAWVYAAQSAVAPRPAADWATRRSALARAAGVLLMPVLVLGGIYGGIFTPTEAAAVSCVYALVLALCLNVRPAQLLPMLTNSASMSTVILLILSAAQLFGYVMTAERIPHVALEYITALELDRKTFLLGVMLFFVISGMFLEVISIILITMPILISLLYTFDIDPIHFGILLILNMELAVITPPIGLNLFVISAISGIPVLHVFRGTLPFVAVFLMFLLLIAFLPGMDKLFELFHRL